jgi:hypothetical protein
MDFSIAIKVISDTASPAVDKVSRACEPGQIARKLRDPLLNVVRRHYETLPPNKNHWPSTGFWKRASDSTYAVDDDRGVTITTYQIGVRQRLLGGTIDAFRAKNLSIPNIAEAYGKLPREFSDLVVMPFGRGQDAPKALVHASDVDFVRNAPDRETADRKILFWLRPSVFQSPDPRVLPSDDEIFSVIDEELNAHFSPQAA